MRVYVSGVHSDANPSSGLGIARSLRAAYPDIELVAVDYSSRSTGLHSEVFDKIWLQRPWDELDPDLYSQRIWERLESGALWISALDLEIVWLAQTLDRHRNLLVPRSHALSMVAKPVITAHQAFPVLVPPYLSALMPDHDLHAFCRRHGWRIWLKGPYHEAHWVMSWPDFEVARSLLRDKWATDGLFLQAHIAGHEESLAFCAYDGVLLDCVYISKRHTTSEGKTWAAQVTEVPPGILEAARSVVADLSWTGGGELEFIRDTANEQWLIDWNPRFPAWIFGAAIAGHNLPALLVQAASGLEPDSMPAASEAFTRVVVEIPCRTDYPLLPLPEPSVTPYTLTFKHPSSMPRLANRLGSANWHPATKLPGGSSQIIKDIVPADVSLLQTPCRLRLDTVARDRFVRFADIASELATFNVKVHVAYSIKTDPDAWLIRIAHDAGMLAEAISQLEVAQAISNGFSPGQIVLNGPAKWWPSQARDVGRFGFVFADSLEELNSYAALPIDRIGVRLRPPFTNSRFGVPLAEYACFQELVSLVRHFPALSEIDLHFHLASWLVGFDQWRGIYDSFIRWAQAIERATGKNVCGIDIGGGWFPEDVEEVLFPRLQTIIAKAEQNLPRLRHFVLEPGRALTQQTHVLAVRVLEVRRQSWECTQVVVDGSISDLPMVSHFPHRIYARNEEEKWEILSRGNDRILGRLCMEDDILAERIHIPKYTKPGQILIVSDAGAYDRSMSYAFGRG